MTIVPFANRVLIGSLKIYHFHIVHRADSFAGKQTEMHIILLYIVRKPLNFPILLRRVTGSPLNEHNAPVMLPNGQIFGQKV